jgi:hypothetical protein
MSAIAFFSDVVECCRLLRHHQQIRDEVMCPSLRRRLARRYVPWAVIPLLSLPWWNALRFPGWVGLVVLGMAAFAPMGVQSPWKLTTFEALRMPSRRSLFVARLLPWLPWWLWVGVCGTAGLLVAYADKVDSAQDAALYLLIGGQVPWLVVGLFAFQPLMPTFGCLVIIACCMLSGALMPLLRDAGINPLEEIHGHLAFIAALMLLSEIGLLIVHVSILGLVEPMRQIKGIAIPPTETPAANKPLMAWVPKAWRTPGPLAPAPLLAGRHGLGWASVYYAFASLWRGGFNGFWQRFYAPVLVLGFMILGDMSNWWMWCMLPALLVQSSLLKVDHPRRLYLLGVDYRAQMLHRITTFWVTPAMLLVPIWVLLAAVLGVAMDWPLAWLALVGGLTLFGAGWYGWPNPAMFFNGKMGCSVILGFHLALGLWLGYLIVAGHGLGIPDPGWSTTMRAQLFAAACGAVGLAGLLYKLLWLDETRLRDTLLELPDQLVTVAAENAATK